MASALTNPTGYNNDVYFYQRPGQPMWVSSPEAYENELEAAAGPEEFGVLDGEAKKSTSETCKSGKMRSSLFLILHTVTSTVLLSSCAGFLFSMSSKAFFWCFQSSLLHYIRP